LRDFYYGFVKMLDPQAADIAKRELSRRDSK
jgi:hypothetical protein